MPLGSVGVGGSLVFVSLVSLWGTGVSLTRTLFFFLAYGIPG